VHDVLGQGPGAEAHEPHHDGPTSAPPPGEEVLDLVVVVVGSGVVTSAFPELRALRRSRLALEDRASRRASSVAASRLAAVTAGIRRRGPGLAERSVVIAFFFPVTTAPPFREGVPTLEVPGLRELPIQAAPFFMFSSICCGDIPRQCRRPEKT